MEIGNGSLSEEVDSVSILKLCKTQSHSASCSSDPWFGTRASSYRMFPMEDLEDDNEDNP